MMNGQKTVICPASNLKNVDCVAQRKYALKLRWNCVNYEHYEQVLLDSVAIIAIENAGAVENKRYSYLTVI